MAIPEVNDVRPEHAGTWPVQNDFSGRIHVFAGHGGGSERSPGARLAYLPCGEVLGMHYLRKNRSHGCANCRTIVLEVA